MREISDEVRYRAAFDWVMGKIVKEAPELAEKMAEEANRIAEEEFGKWEEKAKQGIVTMPSPAEEIFEWLAIEIDNRLKAAEKAAGSR